MRGCAFLPGRSRGCNLPRMSESGPPGGPPTSPPPSGRPGGKRPAIGLQLKLPCATPDEVRARYGADLQQSKFFIRTKQPRPVDTLVRLDALLSPGATCSRAAALVMRVREPPNPTAPVLPRAGDPGMELRLLAVDEAGRELIVSLGGAPPQPLKADPSKAAAQKSAPPMMGPPETAAKPAPPPAKEQEEKPPEPIGQPVAPSGPARKAPMIGID